MKITMPQPVAEVKYGGYASGNELVWTKGAGLQFLPAGTKLYAASVHAPTPVAYLDVGASGYMYLGTDLTEDQVGSFPWGRHILAIVGTYGADGYVPAEWPFDYSEAYQVAQQDLAIWKRRALEAELRVRDQDQIIDRMGDDLNAINGPTFMGGPLLPKQSPAPAAHNPEHTLFNEIRISEPVNEDGEETRYLISEQQLQRIRLLEAPAAPDVAGLVGLCYELMTQVEGELPSLGYLRDNDKSRQIIGRIKDALATFHREG